MIRRRLVAVLALALAVPVAVLVVAAPASAATTITVNTTSDTLVRTSVSLRRALNLAAGDGVDSVIALAAGATYDLTRCNVTSEDANVNGDLDYGDEAGRLTIDGNGATIRQSCAGERVLDLADPAVTLRELRITGGNATVDAGDTTGGGGGVRAKGGLFAPLTGPAPAGVELTIVDTTITGNSAAGNGGGLSAFVSGAAPSGTFGLLRAVITRTEISGNTTAGAGGGVAGIGPLTLTDSSVVQNTAAEVGGVLAGIGMTLRDSTVADSTETAAASASGDGVELDASLGSIILTHTTVRAGEGGGAAVVATGLTSRGSVVDIGRADDACAVANATTSQGANADSDGSCGFTGGTDQSPVADLGLGPVGEFGGATPTIRPAATSPLVDTEATGPGACVPPDADQRGVTRPQGAGCDTGAVELKGKADAQVRKGNLAFVGDDLYDLDGRGQTVAVTARRNQGVTVTLRFQNEGERADELAVQGPASDSKFVVGYVSGRANVTSQVVGGTYRSPTLLPGATDTLVMTLTPRSSTVNGATRRLVVTAASVATAAARDAVGVTVRVVP